MININKKSISKFLAFTVWPNADFFTIEDLNSIEIQDNKNKNLSFFKKEVLRNLETEIEFYNIKKWENIWILLSWGLDSTLLLHLLKQRFSSSKIYTYTLGYKKDDKHFEVAKKISEEYWTIHREIIFDLKRNLEEIFDSIYTTWYDLEWEDSLIMNHILAKEVKKDCKIVFSGFWLDYVFAWMDLFRNSYFEKLYSEWLIDNKYILEALSWNKYYLKYVLDKFNSDLWQEFFPKYWEYYGDNLNIWTQNKVKEYFIEQISNIRSDISELKKQIYFIISTSLSNRYNPYNKPYELVWVKHYNPFGSKRTIKNIISLNIPDNYLYNSFKKEKKYIIREITKDIINKNIIKDFHVWTVLKYEEAIKYNKKSIIKLINNNREFLSMYFSIEYLNGISKEIEDSIWYEKSKQLIIILQLLFYIKNNTINIMEVNVNFVPTLSLV